MKEQNLRSEESRKEIVAAIEKAELNTSGEIRVHIESTWKGDPLERAICIFNRLKMYQTEKRNGILIYVAEKSKKFAIIGDTGINALLPKEYWDVVKDEMSAFFSNGCYVEGVCKAVALVGDSLKDYFPYQSNDENEQTNDVSYGK